MIQLLAFLLFSGFCGLLLIIFSHAKKINATSILGLFLFGILISIPFLMVEHMGSHMKYYLVILVFIAIELGIVLLEKKVKYFHDLVHHNVKRLRITSFVIIGLGFTYSEICFTLLSQAHSIKEIAHLLPLKVTYSLLAHTVLASAASLVRVGTLFAETIYETILKIVSYYGRIVVISLSHYLYIFSMEKNLIIMIVAMLTVSIITFFYLKKHLDVKHMAA